jgi:hypothetical protein
MMHPETDEQHARLAVADFLSGHLNEVISAYTQEHGLNFFNTLHAARRIVSNLLADIPCDRVGIFTCTPDDIYEGPMLPEIPPADVGEVCPSCGEFVALGGHKTWCNRA